MSCPPGQDPVFPTTSLSHQEAYTSLLASSTRRQTEARGTTVPTETKTKPHYGKLISMKKQKCPFQMKGQIKPQKNI